MNTTNPIIPPPELVQQCWDELRDQTQDLDAAKAWGKAITLAYQAGADQELEACCEWLDTEKILTKDGGYIRKLRAARRPKPPSLKEQALLVIDTAVNDYRMSSDAASIIRRALEALDD